MFQIHRHEENCQINPLLSIGVPMTLVAANSKAPGHTNSRCAGGYVFAASPTGNKAIAYDPVTKVSKSVALNASKENPLKITPISGSHVQHVALRLQGSKITRVAVFDLKSGRWLPMDLDEPAKGDVTPTYIGHSGTAYDVGRHVYTFNAATGEWDHLDTNTISDQVDDEGSAKASGK